MNWFFILFVIFNAGLNLAQQAIFNDPQRNYPKIFIRNLDKTEMAVTVLPGEAIILKQNKSLELRPLALRNNTVFTFYMTKQDQTILGEKLNAVIEGINVWNRTGHPGIKIELKVVDKLQKNLNVISFHKKNLIKCALSRQNAFTINYPINSNKISFSHIVFCNEIDNQSYDKIKGTVVHEVAHTLGIDHLMTTSATSRCHDGDGDDIIKYSYGFLHLI